MSAHKRYYLTPTITANAPWRAQMAHIANARGWRYVEGIHPYDGLFSVGLAADTLPTKTHERALFSAGFEWLPEHAVWCVVVGDTARPYSVIGMSRAQRCFERLAATVQAQPKSMTDATA